MARVEQLEFGWKFGDSLTSGGFQRVLEDRVERVSFIDLDGHGYTIPTFNRKGAFLQFAILIKADDPPDEQKMTLVHESIHIHRGIDLTGKIHNMFSERNPEDEQSRREEEEQVESEAVRFVKRYPEIVDEALNKYKNGL